MEPLVEAIDQVIGGPRPVGHHQPSINGHEIYAVTECLKGNIAGDFWQQKLERQLADYCNVDNAVVVASGTAALHLSLVAAGVKPNDEVLLPSMTFAATANSICHANAYPHFVDGPPHGSKLQAYLRDNTVPHSRGRLNPVTGRVISAVIAVDLLGVPADYGLLTKVADEFGLTLLEDAAQALGSSLGNQRCGSFGAAASLSFNNNKIIIGNGGGAVLTNDARIAAKVRELSTQARAPHPWLIEHTTIAWNYRMPSLCAALASAQMDRIDEFLAAKQKFAKRCFDRLSGFTQLFKFPLLANPNMKLNYWLVTFLLAGVWAQKRDELLEALHQRGIHARALFTPLHTLPMFAHCPRQPNFDWANQLHQRAICLPSGVGL